MFQLNSKGTNLYCSRSCAVTVNNSKSPKRKLTKQCKTCNNFIASKRVLCDECIENKSILHKTVGEAKVLSTGNANVRLRELARMMYRRYVNAGLVTYNCAKCSYDKHVDICHIKDLYQYRNDELVKDTFTLDNLIALCKNCHWEFDNGFILFNGIEKKFRPSSQSPRTIEEWKSFKEKVTHCSILSTTHWSNE